jgi:hypothetical protein
MNQYDIERRQGVSRYIHSLWTMNGSDDSGLAAPFLEGRIDVLGIYVSFEDFKEEWRDAEAEAMDCPSNTKVDCRNCCDLSYHDFNNNYMIPNMPVILRGLTKTWKAAREWVDDAGEPDLAKLASLFGTDAANVHVQPHAGFSQARPQLQDWSVQEYALWWYEHHEAKDDDRPLLYLKDYTFVAMHPDYQAYECPVYFQDDWLNEYTRSAYKFVYLGPKGTSTRLHADVLRSYSWSTNVCGVKRWYLIPPKYAFLLYDVFSQHLASHLQCNDATLYPGLRRARTFAIEIIQQAGETVFVPSGWHHTVENLAPTLSINHNWLNGINVHWSWAKLKTELESLSLETGKSANGETLQSNDPGGQSGSTQIGDDLFLLWMILSTKAQSILNTERDAMAIVNMNACLSVLKEMRHFVDQGKDQGLTERCECHIGRLILSIENYLDSPDSIDKG